MNINLSPSPKMAQRILKENFTPVSESIIAPLADTIVRLGRLSVEDAARVTEAQKKTKTPFGRTAVSMGLLSRADLQYALGVQLGFLHETDDPVVIPAALASVKNPYSKTAEQFRAMRTRMLTGGAPDDLSLFAVTGADKRAGADFIAINLAASFAQLGKRVALVDAGLKSPRLGKIFAAGDSKGVSDFVVKGAGIDEIAYQTLIKNLDLVPAGARVADTQMVLAAERMNALLQRLRNKYEIVVVLTEQFGASTDVEYVWSAAGQALIVVRKDHSRVEVLRNIEAAARRASGMIIGAALTS